jgi:hypothetical protein
LQRIDSTGYGDDPINWQAASPTAGTANAGTGSLDTDGDGLPDSWELANGLDYRSASGDDGASGDPDGDGATNAQEFLSGTNPRDSTSYLKIEFLNAAGAPTRIHFNVVAGKTYTVLYCDNVDGGPWIGITNVAAQPFTGEVEIADPGAITARTRFYRLVTPRQP